MRHLSTVLAVVGLAALAGCSSSAGTGTTPSSGSSAPPTTTTTTATTTTTTTPASSSARPSSSSSSSGTTVPASAPVLHNFRVADLTWIGDDGWALGTANCLSGSGTCDAVEHTTDGGRSWSSLPAPRTAVVLPNGDTGTCKSECLDGLRFATTKIGYAFGRADLSQNQSHAFYVTADGGRTWQQQAGNAEALETLHGAVIRIVTSTPGCPPGCAYRVQRAAVGSSAWHDIALPSGTQQDGAELGWAGDNVYLETTGHVAGGAENAESTMFTSADNGLHWTRRGEVCPQSGREVDSSQLSVGPDGSATVLCRVRATNTGQVVAATANGGASFAVSTRRYLGSAFITAVGAITPRTWIVSSDRLYRTTNGGDTYSVVGNGLLGWIAFGSSNTGHGISTDYRSVWTTTNAGATWRAYTFH